MPYVRHLADCPAMLRVLRALDAWGRPVRPLTLAGFVGPTTRYGYAAIHRAARRGYVALAQDPDAPRGVRLASLTDTGRAALGAL